jgi:hypothetical protein
MATATAMIRNCFDLSIVQFYRAGRIYKYGSSAFWMRGAADAGMYHAALAATKPERHEDNVNATSGGHIQGFPAYRQAY